LFLNKPKTLIKGLDFSYRLDLYAGDRLIDRMDVDSFSPNEIIKLSLDIDGVLIDRIVATLIIDNKEYENEIYKRHDNDKELEVAP